MKSCEFSDCDSFYNLDAVFSRIVDFVDFKKKSGISCDMNAIQNYVTGAVLALKGVSPCGLKSLFYLSSKISDYYGGEKSE